jgi:hypothetical protein
MRISSGAALWRFERRREPSKRWQRAFKKRCSCRHWIVLQNEATGARDGIAEENAVGEVELIDAMSIMVQPMDPAGHGCAERARRSR